MTVEELLRTPIEIWDVSKTEYMNMRWMFYGAKPFNPDLETWCPKLHPDADVTGMFVGLGLEGNEPSWYLEKISK